MELDTIQSPSIIPAESSSHPRIFRAPNDPELGTPLNVTSNIGAMLPGYWVPLNGHEDQQVSPAPERGSKRNRLPGQNQQAADLSLIHI